MVRARMGGAAIAIGADHGGFALKEQLKKWLVAHGHAVEDCGAYDEKPVDYPVVAAAVARKVSEGRVQKGVIIDGAGIGSSMVANKLAGVRAALCYDVSSARNSREHNDANVLTLGARLIGPGLAEQILEVWLGTDCTEARHQARVAMIGAIEKEGASCASCHPALAGTPAPNQNAPVSDPRFQERAAKWLMTDDLEKLSAADLDRVAGRIAELLAKGEQRGNLWCFGDVCIDARSAKPWIEAGVARLSGTLGGGAGMADIAGYIDHTLLKPDATEKQVLELCDEAAKHGFVSVCVNPGWVPLCARRLSGTRVKVCTVVGFPLGANQRDVKAAETRRAIRDGAREIDMVINIGQLKSGHDKEVLEDIRAVVDACEDGRSLSKVIIETALLTDEEKVRACVLARKARADFVKTSTGFASGGATAADVALMARAVSGAGMGVKASGGVKSLADFEAMVRAGATRIGASAGVKILKEAGK
jgi:deoxyribose-phosphate aldolase